MGCGASVPQMVASRKNTGNRTKRRYHVAAPQEQSAPGNDPFVMDTIIAMRSHFALDALRTPHTDRIRQWIDYRDAHYPIEVYMLEESCPCMSGLTASNLALHEAAWTAPCAPRRCRHNFGVRVDSFGGRRSPGYLELPSRPMSEKLSTLG